MRSRPRHTQALCWHSAPFGNLRATPTDGKAITKFPNQDEALAIVASDVRIVVEKINRKLGISGTSVPANSIERPLTTSDPVPAAVRSRNLRVKHAFSDRDRDGFLDESFEYVAKFFETSLDELSKRNSRIDTSFKRFDARSLVASIYEAGKRVAVCSVWYGGGSFDKAINYSNSASGPVGAAYFQSRDEKLSQEGAAEYFWSLLLTPLQN
jgi:hypothetical protein